MKTKNNKLENSKNLEIEKKYWVSSYKETIEQLKNLFGNPVDKLKAGYWWCSNYSAMSYLLDVTNPMINKQDIEAINDIGEYSVPLEAFQFVRLRIVNNDSFLITFKQKSLVNNIEKNIEYEYEADKEIFRGIFGHLKNNLLIFYYNIKETKVFKYQDVMIELSTFNNIKNPYLEIEATGQNETELFNKINEVINKIDTNLLKEEPKSYIQIFKKENKENLKNKKLFQYSKEGVDSLENLLK